MTNYPDHHPLYPIAVGFNEATRMLMFHSTPIELEYLEEALNLIGNYNEFNPQKVFKVLSKAFGDKCEYVVGREYSPVIYIIPKKLGYFWIENLKTIKSRTKADEVAVEGIRLRMWWD